MNKFDLPFRDPGTGKWVVSSPQLSKRGKPTGKDTRLEFDSEAEALAFARKNSAPLQKKPKTDIRKGEQTLKSVRTVGGGLPTLGMKRR